MEIPICRLCQRALPRRVRPRDTLERIRNKSKNDFLSDCKYQVDKSADGSADDCAYKSSVSRGQNARSRD